MASQIRRRPVVLGRADVRDAHRAVAVPGKKQTGDPESHLLAQAEDAVVPTGRRDAPHQRVAGQAAGQTLGGRPRRYGHREGARVFQSRGLG